MISHHFTQDGPQNHVETLLCLTIAMSVDEYCIEHYSSTRPILLKKTALAEGGLKLGFCSSPYSQCSHLNRGNTFTSCPVTTFDRLLL